jgi:hypothetical protein|tara:strand:+ start:1699 stop:1884 length:186 start_codon:yes stop_codon:yes gene_type:complete
MMKIRWPENEEIDFLRKKCDMQDKILQDVNFLLKYYTNNIDRKLQQYEQFVKSSENNKKSE